MYNKNMLYQAGKESNFFSTISETETAWTTPCCSSCPSVERIRLRWCSIRWKNSPGPSTVVCRANHRCPRWRKRSTGSTTRCWWCTTSSRESEGTFLLVRASLSRSRPLRVETEVASRGRCGRVGREVARTIWAGRCLRSKPVKII